MRVGAEAALGRALTAVALLAQAPVADIVTAIDGNRLTGTFTGIDAEGVVQIRAASGELHRLALSGVQLVELQPRAEAPPATWRDGVWLRSGQALPLRLQGADAAGASFSWPYEPALVKLPWRFVRAVLCGDAEPDPGFTAALSAPPEDADLLYALHSDGEVRRLSVRFLGAEGDVVRVAFGGEERTVALERVHGIVFGQRSGAPPDPLPNPRVRLVLQEGRWFEGKVVEMDAARCRLALDEGVTVAVPVAALARLVVRSDRLVDLTELTPKLEQIAAFDRAWPPLTNKGPGGGPIRLGGKNFEKGFVLVPRTRLSWSVDGRYDTLQGLVGLEERAGASAHAFVRVIGDDGAVLFDSGPLTPGVAPLRLAVSLAGVQTLTFEADFGQNLDLGDLCVIAEPRLLKQ